MTDVALAKAAVQFFEKNLNCNFSETDAAQLHTARSRHATTARTFLQCVGAERARAASSTRMPRAVRLLQVAETDFGEIEVQSLEKILSFNFSTNGTANLHAACLRQAPTARLALRRSRSDGASAACSSRVL